MECGGATKRCILLPAHGGLLYSDPSDDAFKVELLATVLLLLQAYRYSREVRKNPVNAAGFFVSALTGNVNISAPVT